MHPYLPFSLADDLERNARWHGDHPAYVQGTRQVSHRQLLERARCLGSALHKAGVRNQDRVGILAMNSLEFGEVIAACQFSGYILATVNFRLAPAEIAWIVNDGAPRVLFFEARYLAVVEQLREQMPSVEAYICIDGEAEWATPYGEFIAGGDAEGPPCRAREEDAFCLIYTSGTTGKPKGCIWGHRELRQLVQVDAWLVNLEQPDRILIVMPMFHIGGLVLSQCQHLAGGTAHLYPEFDPSQIIRGIVTEKLTVLLLAPTMVQMLLDDPAIENADLSSVRTVLYSAAPMPPTLLRKAIRVFDGCDFVNLFGQTEVVPAALSALQHNPDGTEVERARLTSIGQPYPNMEIKIIDEAGEECPVNEPGELLARGVAMFRGYWNNSVATVETLRDGWVHTGDMARVDEDGFIYLVDRKKDVIISGGENVYSREVEEAILQHPDVSECAVIGIADDKWGEVVCALVVTRPGRSLSEQDIVGHTREFIASYKKPKRVEFLDQLPKLVTGKVDKKALRKRYTG